MLRRIVLPIALTAAVIGCAFGAKTADRDAFPALAEAGPTTAGATTPLFSVRRAPQWLLRPTADVKLRTALEAIIAASPTDTCLEVRDNGRLLYAHNPDTAQVPASTVKLLTAFAALTELGPDATFNTTAVAAAAPQAGVLTGNLFIVGGGDPILATKDYVDRFGQAQPFTNVATLIDRIAAAGITQIRGDIVGDESRYDTKRYVSSWDPSFIAGHESGPLSALAMNNGFAAYPASKFNSSATPADDPAQLAANVIRQLLVQKGIKVSGVARSGKAPTGTVEVARVTATLNDIVTEMLSQSDNYAAESLTKELGLKLKNSPTTEAGVVAAREILTKAGLPMQGVAVVDGSGLDRTNRLTCDFLATLLDRAGPTSIIAKALPTAGKTGTLAERFLGSAATGHLHAKTGSLRNSRALAGFVDIGGTSTPRTLTFAYIANATNLNADANVKLQDQLGIDLATYPKGPTLTELGPR